MNRLETLHSDFNQSIWIDHLSRTWLADGSLKAWISRGCRGITSNPTIFEKCLTAEDAYDADLSKLLAEGVSVEDAYWHLAADDVAEAAEQLADVHAESNGEDGFVSVEVSPQLARDTEATIAAAKDLRSRFAAENIYIKVPATEEGVKAMVPLITDGINLNITLIFSLERYRQVAEAYIEALEELALANKSSNKSPSNSALAGVAGVASFFVSRVDTEVDSRLNALDSSKHSNSERPNSARSNAEYSNAEYQGKAAIAQAKLAYQTFQELFSGPRWDRLAALGARPQRPLWASTSTKNPAYPDTLYVDHLIGPHTVNTLPETTANAFDDHGSPSRTIDADLKSAQTFWHSLPQTGIDMTDVATLLEDQGLAAFSKSFENALDALEKKAKTLNSGVPR